MSEKSKEELVLELRVKELEEELATAKVVATHKGLRQYIHNDLGIKKENIREWIDKEIEVITKREVMRVVEVKLENFSIDSYVRNAIRGDYIRSIESAIMNEVRAQVKGKVTVTLGSN